MSEIIDIYIIGKSIVFWFLRQEMWEQIFYVGLFAGLFKFFGRIVGGMFKLIVKLI